jgi:hypothetical protein
MILKDLTPIFDLVRGYFSSLLNRQASQLDARIDPQRSVDSHYSFATCCYAGHAYKNH